MNMEAYKLKNEFRPEGWQLTKKELRWSARYERLQHIKQVVAGGMIWGTTPSEHQLAVIWGDRMKHWLSWIANGILNAHQVEADVKFYTYGRKFQVVIPQSLPTKVIFDLCWQLRIASRLQGRSLRVVFDESKLKSDAVVTNVFRPGV